MSIVVGSLFQVHLRLISYLLRSDLADMTAGIFKHNVRVSQTASKREKLSKKCQKDANEEHWLILLHCSAYYMELLKLQPSLLVVGHYDLLI